jgi:hypothetical protein
MGLLKKTENMEDKKTEELLEKYGINNLINSEYKKVKENNKKDNFERRKEDGIV